jgi:hypothetical protein
MEKRILTLPIAAIIVTLLIAAALLSTQNLTPTPKIAANITDFSVDWGSTATIVGVTTAITFNITIQNTGTTNLTNLNINLALLNNQTKPINPDTLYPQQVNFTLTTGETKSTQIDYFINLDNRQHAMQTHQNYQATLTTNNTTLAQRKLY